MTPTHAIKKGVRYRYYVSRRLITGTRGKEKNDPASGQRVPAANLERLVVQRLRSLFADPVAVLESLPRSRRDAPSQRRANAAATEIVRALDDRREDAWSMIFRPIIVRVQVGLDRIDVDLSAEHLIRNREPIEILNEAGSSEEILRRANEPRTDQFTTTARRTRRHTKGAVVSSRRCGEF